VSFCERLVETNDHPYFEEIAALAASGQISDEECDELLKHLTQCRLCRSAERAFRDIVECLWPTRDQLHAMIDKLQELPQDEDIRARFFERAKKERIEFSRDVPKRENSGKP
jgi:hypothetical protein